MPAKDITDPKRRSVGSSVDLEGARLQLAYWVLAGVAVLLVAAVAVRVWPYPTCENCDDAIAYSIEGRRAVFAFATTFLPSLATLVLGYWFRDRQDGNSG